MGKLVVESSNPGSKGLWHYETLPGHFDEVVGVTGKMQPAWHKLIGSLEAMGVAELDRRWEQGQRLIHENGVTYNIYDDAGGLNRPWNLDAIPFVIDSKDWAHIEAAIEQRAELLNRVLLDLYGPQQLFADGLLPPELLFANNGFLRAAKSIDVSNGIYLHQYAADLARSPNGDWWVVNDRTQAPSGAGYALENRLVMARSLPEVFRDCQVTRLAEFFASLRELLAQSALTNKDRPRIVMLTPGPYNETYFEHAYLARYLGFTLVEPGDLTVRDGRVFLKTLDALMPVDVILRRMDDAFCDQLELLENSLLGVPGLVHAARSGNVVIANALGSGVIQSPAMMAFLPALAKKMLGEPLLMPSVATWWCGHEKPLEHTLSNLTELVVKSTFYAGSDSPIFGDSLSRDEQAKLADRIRADPHLFVAQERVHLSTAPTWVDDAIQPRHLMLRVYAVAKPDGGYSVMPGGLTRVSGSKDSTSVDMRSGGGSKDTWVLSDEPVHYFSLLSSAGNSAELTRQGFALSSRVADNLYWLGRMAERIEGATRVVRCAIERLTDDTDLSDADELPWLVDVLVVQGRMIDGLDRENVEQELKSLGAQIMSLLFDGERPNSIRADVQKIYRLGSVVRDRISIDAWRILTRLESQVVLPKVSDALKLSSALQVLDDIILTLTAFSGQTIEGMTHEKGWRFLEMGRRIERAQNMLDLLTGAMGKSDDADSQRMQSLLEIANNAMTYRSRYQSSVEAAPVLDLLVLDESNPRSLAYQFVELEKHVRNLVGEVTDSRRPEEQRVAMRALTAVRLIEIDMIAQPNGKKNRKALLRVIDRLRSELNELSKAVTRRYLSHARPTRRLTDLGGRR